MSLTEADDPSTLDFDLADTSDSRFYPLGGGGSETSSIRAGIDEIHFGLDHSGDIGGGGWDSPGHYPDPNPPWNAVGDDLLDWRSGLGDLECDGLVVEQPSSLPFAPDPDSVLHHHHHQQQRPHARPHHQRQDTREELHDDMLESVLDVYNPYQYGSTGPSESSNASSAESETDENGVLSVVAMSSSLAAAAEKADEEDDDDEDIEDDDDEPNEDNSFIVDSCDMTSSRSHSVSTVAGVERVIWSNRPDPRADLATSPNADHLGAIASPSLSIDDGRESEYSDYVDESDVDSQSDLEVGDVDSTPAFNLASSIAPGGVYQHEHDGEQAAEYAPEDAVQATDMDVIVSEFAHPSTAQGNEDAYWPLGGRLPARQAKAQAQARLRTTRRNTIRIPDRSRIQEALRAKALVQSRGSGVRFAKAPRTPSVSSSQFANSTRGPSRSNSRRSGGTCSSLASAVGSRVSKPVPRTTPSSTRRGTRGIAVVKRREKYTVEVDDRGQDDAIENDEVAGGYDVEDDEDREN